MLSLDLKRYYEPLRFPLRPAALSFPYTLAAGGLPTAVSGLQHWAINLLEHADPATPEVDG